MKLSTGHRSSLNEFQGDAKAHITAYLIKDLFMTENYFYCCNIGVNLK